MAAQSTTVQVTRPVTALCRIDCSIVTGVLRCVHTPLSMNGPSDGPCGDVCVHSAHNQPDIASALSALV